METDTIKRTKWSKEINKRGGNTKWSNNEEGKEKEIKGIYKYEIENMTWNIRSIDEEEEELVVEEEERATKGVK